MVSSPRRSHVAVRSRAKTEQVRAPHEPVPFLSHWVVGARNPKDTPPIAISPATVEEEEPFVWRDVFRSRRHMAAGAVRLRSDLNRILNPIFLNPVVSNVRRKFGFPVKSFAAIFATYVLIGITENVPAGTAGMWMNMLTIGALVGALMVFVNLRREDRSVAEAIAATTILILWWEVLFGISESFTGMFLTPGDFGFHALSSMFKAQSPYIWWTFITPFFSGTIGCGVYLFLQVREESRASKEPLHKS